MTFDEWWNQRKWHPIGCEELAREAWNAAIQEYASGVLQPILDLAQTYLTDIARMGKTNAKV